MRLSGRRWLAPEVVQTSAMDCGPASLKCLLEGLGVRVSYDRLREACQTDVDGTSIDTLEEVANALGLNAEQIMLPRDHVLTAEANALPALAVVRLPNGNTHFVVAWGQAAGLVQVMDPGVGRLWLPKRRFLDELYVHAMPVPAEGWREWAGSDDFLRVLASRMAALGASASSRAALQARAQEEPSWRSLAALDAATRLTAALVSSGTVARGAQSTAVLHALLWTRIRILRRRSCRPPIGRSGPLRPPRTEPSS